MEVHCDDSELWDGRVCAGVREVRGEGGDSEGSDRAQKDQTQETQPDPKGE